MCVWWSVFEMRDKSSDPFLPSCQTLRIGTFCQSKLRGDGARGQTLDLAWQAPAYSFSLANSGLCTLKRIKFGKPGEQRVKPPGEETVTSGNFLGNRQKFFLSHMCPRPILPAIEEGTLEKGQLLVFPDPGSWTAPPFVPADAASKEVTRGGSPSCLRKWQGDSAGTRS